jgi:16S rRNA (guanine966-N2)-methyltransferase
MRIIAGKHRGRNIETVSSKKLRPTTGMAREALFNILSHGRFSQDGESLIQDCRVLDLFCGCGALSLEALSRGAVHATLIDIDQAHLDIASKNLRVMGEEENASLIRGDSSTPPPASVPCNLVFLDPPYGRQFAPTALKGIIHGGWLAHDAIVVIETGKTEELETPKGFEELDDRKHGNSRIRILRWLG